MIGTHHVAETLDPRRAVIAGRWRKETERVIAPEVFQAAIEQVLIVREPVNRQQLDRGNAEAFDVLHRRFMPHPLKRTAQFRRNSRVKLGKTFDVALIDHGMRPRDIGSAGVLPVNGIGVDDLTFGRKRRAVSRIKAEIQLIVSQLIAEVGIVPLNVTHQFTGIGVNKQLIGIEAVTVLRIVRAIHTVTIQRPRFQIRHIAVPDLMGIFRQFQAGYFCFSRRIKQTQLYPLRVGGKQSEVHPFPVIICAQLLAMTGPNFKRCILWHFCSPQLFAGKQNQQTSLFRR